MLVLRLVRRISAPRIPTCCLNRCSSFQPLSNRIIHTRAMSSAVASSSSAPVQTPSTINLRELLSVCHDLSEHAGRSIRRIFDSGNLGAIDKDPAAAAAESAAKANSRGSTGGVDFGPISDPQTLADLESQRIIIGNLQRLYGTGLKIVGEEGELENSTGEQTLVREARKDLLAREKFPEELLQLETKDLTLWVDPLDGTKEFTLSVE
jgi:3'(2'), 5'-bisphosphate nucleotidase